MTQSTTRAQPSEPQMTDAESRLDAWRTKRAGIQARLNAIGPALETTAAELSDARRESMLAGDDASSVQLIASLVGRREALTAERAELTERLPLALAEEETAQKAHDVETAELRAAELISLAADLRHRAAVSNGEIDAAIRRLYVLLDRRHGFELEARDLAEGFLGLQALAGRAGTNLSIRALDVDGVALAVDRIRALIEVRTPGTELGLQRHYRIEL